MAHGQSASTLSPSKWTGPKNEVQHCNTNVISKNALCDPTLERVIHALIYRARSLHHSRYLITGQKELCVFN
jgi:hypothetical protein